MKEFNKDNINDFKFNRFNSYFLITGDDLYKLQTVNNIYAQDSEKMEYAFCPFSTSYCYFGGLIGDPKKIIKNIIENRYGHVYESESNRGLENLYQLLSELYVKVNNISELDEIKLKESQKAGYDVGVVRALLALISNRYQFS